eukprot:3780347-Amphidinium_carterae.1
MGFPILTKSCLMSTSFLQYTMSSRVRSHLVHLFSGRAEVNLIVYALCVGMAFLFIDFPIGLLINRSLPFLGLMKNAGVFNATGFLVGVELKGASWRIASCLPCLSC